MNPTCPRKEEFLRFFLNEMSPDEKESFVDHAYSCPDCRIKLEVLVPLSRELREKSAEIDCVAFTAAEQKEFKKLCKARLRELKKPKRPAFRLIPRRVFAGVLVGASALLVLFVAYRFLFVTSAPGNIARNTTGEKVLLIEPKGSLMGPPSGFAWKPYQGADVYIFKLVDEDLRTLVAGKPTYTPSYALPEAIKKQLEPGKRYIWSVEVMDDDNKKIAFTQEFFVIKGSQR